MISFFPAALIVTFFTIIVGSLRYQSRMTQIKKHLKKADEKVSFEDDAFKA